MRRSTKNDGVGSLAVLVTELSYLVLSFCIFLLLFSGYNFKTIFVTLSCHLGCPKISGKTAQQHLVHEVTVDPGFIELKLTRLHVRMLRGYIQQCNCLKMAD